MKKIIFTLAFFLVILGGGFFLANLSGSGGKEQKLEPKEAPHIAVDQFISLPEGKLKVSKLQPLENKEWQIFFEGDKKVVNLVGSEYDIFTGKDDVLDLNNTASLKSRIEAENGQEEKDKDKDKREFFLAGKGEVSLDQLYLVRNGKVVYTIDLPKGFIVG